jgi:hypothetical protein
MSDESQDEDGNEVYDYGSDDSVVQEVSALTLGLLSLTHTVTNGAGQRLRL